MPGYELMVVALSCTEADASLIAYAAMLAKLGGTREIRFVHVAEAPSQRAGVRDRMRAKVAPLFKDTIHTECDVVTGPLTDRLLAYVSELQADLILIGSKKHKLGARLAMVAPCSVGVIPNAFPARLTHLMVAIDFSDSAATTLEWATRLVSGDRNIECTGLHVMTHESADLFAERESEPEQAQAMRQIVARADRSGVAVKPRLASVSRTGEISRHQHRFFLPASIQGADVAHAILAEAEGCGADCIAMGTRGRSASASILLGSVTEKVIERATLPLLVCKHSGASLGLAEILLGSVGWRTEVKTN